MRASKARISSLNTITALESAIESIESDHCNYHGGIDRWLSGNTTTLFKTARDKITQIYSKIERMEGSA